MLTIRYLRITNSADNNSPVDLTGHSPTCITYGAADAPAVVEISDAANGILQVEYDSLANGSALVVVDCGVTSLGNSDRYREVEFQPNLVDVQAWLGYPIPADTIAGNSAGALHRSLDSSTIIKVDAVKVGGVAQTGMDLAGDATNGLAAIKTRLNTLATDLTSGVAAAAVVSPLTSELDLQLVSGDAYDATTNQGIVFTDGGTWPTMHTNSEVKLCVAALNSIAPRLTIAGTVAVGPPQTISVPLTAAQTATLVPGQGYQYELRVNLGSSEIRTLAAGNVLVLPSITPAW